MAFFDPVDPSTESLLWPGRVGFCIVATGGVTRRRTFGSVCIGRNRSHEAGVTRGFRPNSAVRLRRTAPPRDDRIPGERSSRRPRAGDAFATPAITPSVRRSRSLRSGRRPPPASIRRPRRRRRALSPRDCSAQEALARRLWWRRAQDRRCSTGRAGVRAIARRESPPDPYGRRAPRAA